MGRSSDRIGPYTWRLSREDRLLRRIRVQSDEHREQHKCDVHPSSPVKGRLLDILVRSTKSRKVLEVGCGLGYSAIWLARAMPKGGSVDTLERDPLHASIAMRNFRLARVQSKVRVIRGEASRALSRLKEKYDFIFEDAAYGEKPRYYENLIRLLKTGGYIHFSNWFPIEAAIIGGRTLRRWKRDFRPWSSAPTGTKLYVEDILRDRRLSAVILPHVWFGMAVKISG